MAYLRRSILILLSAFIALVPGVSFAAGFFGPIVPEGCYCNNKPIQGGGGFIGSAPDYGCVLAVIQNLIQFAVTLGVILCVLWIAYAGFSLMVSGGSAEARSQGKTRIVNALVGILVILSAWLVVNFVMNVLYNGKFGAWNSILAADSSSQCITPKEPTAITAGSLLTTLTTVAPGTANGLPSGNAGDACNPSKIQTAAQTAGVNMPSTEAVMLACLAGPESTCGSNLQNYNWNGVKDPRKPSTAYGPFQVLLSTNSNCYDNNTCEVAAGVSGPLNCKSGFSNGRPIPGSQTVANCIKAASNLGCSAAAADCLYRQNGNYNAWTTDKNSAKQQACIAQYSAN